VSGGCDFDDISRLCAVLCRAVQVSLVLEYCDWGSLRTALDAGAFFAGEHDMRALEAVPVKQIVGVVSAKTA
jgi:hypothetical protein